jgi:hypothetical protein
MFMYSGNSPGSTGVNRVPFFVGLAFLLLLVQTGITSAESPDTTITTSETATVTTTLSDRTGGSIYFETNPPGAMIWLDSARIGTSPFMYYSEKTGVLDVRAWRKGYENFTGTIAVEEGKRVDFYALLTPVSQKTPAGTTAVPVSTATTIRKSTLDIPTPWPTTTESPVDAAVIVGAVAGGIAVCVIRRR